LGSAGIVSLAPRGDLHAATTPLCWGSSVLKADVDARRIGPRVCECNLFVWVGMSSLRRASREIAAFVECVVVWTRGHGEGFPDGVVAFITERVIPVRGILPVFATEILICGLPSLASYRGADETVAPSLRPDRTYSSMQEFIESIMLTARNKITRKCAHASARDANVHASACVRACVRVCACACSCACACGLHHPCLLDAKVCCSLDLPESIIEPRAGICRWNFCVSGSDPRTARASHSSA
jgi:hypothetical protein